MSDIVAVKNIGAYLAPLPAIAPNTVSAPTGTQQTGLTIDRFKTPNGNQMRSMVSCLVIKGVLAAHKKLTIARKVEHAQSTSTGWATYGTAPTNVVIGSTGATAAQTINTTINDSIDLNGAFRFLRIDVTPTFSATSADTMALAATAILGGPDKAY